MSKHHPDGETHHTTGEQHHPDGEHPPADTEGSGEHVGALRDAGDGLKDRGAQLRDALTKASAQPIDADSFGLIGGLAAGDVNDHTTKVSQLATTTSQHLDSAGELAHASASLYENNEQNVKQSFDKLAPDTDTTVTSGAGQPAEPRIPPEAHQVGSPDHTSPSTEPNPAAVPAGEPETDPRASGQKQRDLQLQNEAAAQLQQAGYQVVQQPGVLPNGKRPDYTVEGQVFDHLAPTSSNVEQVRKGIKKKVAAGQAYRIVLNLANCSVDLNDLRGILARKPVENLREIIVVNGDEIIHFFPS